jgi:2-methylcitrate dehydratase PrpD
MSTGDVALAERLGEFAAAHPYDTLPDEVRDSVRRRVLDVIGLCAAATPLDTSQAAIAWARAQGGAAQSHAVGVPEALPANEAAFVNGVLAHSLDYDDTHLPSILHPSASVVPAALAAAESAGAPGRDVIAAVAAGLEICVRLGMAGYDREEGNSLFFERGQHATSICGAIAGAASAALLLGLGVPGVTNAMGVAVSMASGVIEANRTGGTVKRLHCGWAAHAAVSAAQLVQRGFTGPPTALEGRFGFFEAFLSGRFAAEELTAGLGTRWEVPGIFFKPYPANHFTHTGIDAAIALRERGLRPEQVRRIILGVAAPTVRTIGEPIDVKRTPDTGYSAQFSGPYTATAALLGGGGLGLALDDFTDELARDPRRRELMATVDVVGDDRCTEIYPYQFPAVLTVETVDGSTLEEQVLVNRGGPGRPLTAEELTRKFNDNAGRVLDADATRAIEEAVWKLDQLADVADVLAPAARPLPV